MRRKIFFHTGIPRQGGELLSRRLDRVAWVLLGALLALAVEVFWIYAAGVTVVVPAGEVLAAAREAEARVAPLWPRVRQHMLQQLRPLVEQEVAQIVDQVTIEVGGLTVRLPPTLKGQLTADLSRLVFRELSEQLATKIRLNQLLSPALAKAVLSQPWDFHLAVRTGPVAIPVTVKLEPVSPPLRVPLLHELITSRR